MALRLPCCGISSAPNTSVDKITPGQGYILGWEDHSLIPSTRSVSGANTPQGLARTSSDHGYPGLSSEAGLSSSPPRRPGRRAVGTDLGLAPAAAYRRQGRKARHEPN